MKLLLTEKGKPCEIYRRICNVYKEARFRYDNMPTRPTSTISTSSSALWPFDSLVVSLISGQGHFTCFTSTQHTQQNNQELKKRREDKHALVLAPSARKEREKFLALYWHSVLLCCLDRVLEENPLTGTRSADSSSRAR